MPTAKRKTSQPAQPLDVVSAVWERHIVFKTKAGKLREVDTYDDAREYAKNNGYSGIRIRYV